MRLGAIPRGVVERIAFALGLVPTPLLDSIIALLLARTVMVATRLGVFEDVRDGVDVAHLPARR